MFTIDTTAVPGHCPKGCKWPGDHLLQTNLFNFPVQGNYLVRKFLKCILLGVFWWCLISFVHSVLKSKWRAEYLYWDGAGGTGTADIQGKVGLQRDNPRAFLQPAGTLFQRWGLLSPWRSQSVPSPLRTGHDPYLSTSAAQHLRMSFTEASRR